jgi:hypothetical protein
MDAKPTKSPQIAGSMANIHDRATSTMLGVVEPNPPLTGRPWDGGAVYAPRTHGPLRRRRAGAFGRRDAPRRPVDLRDAAARQPLRTLSRYPDHRDVAGTLRACSDWPRSSAPPPRSALAGR